ncbi:glycosyltransferase [Methylosinus sporium]|uniref:Glycosyltransferase n=1 Tax=Methylosinus sporium TaxID=428 RepID=A0A549SHJ4_METSR|nr:glycosyltransferase [Methylosinus sp. KRF6]TRL29076.1 glycosyltransferase [Methylosinus sporium]
MPDELIVCDDGSSDETLPIVEAFAKRAPFPVMVYRNEANLGYTKNFETAARRCRGDIVFFPIRMMSGCRERWKPLKQRFAPTTVSCCSSRTEKSSIVTCCGVVLRSSVRSNPDGERIWVLRLGRFPRCIET